MKARKQGGAAAAAAASPAQKQASPASDAVPAIVVDDSADINSGFGDWLRSADGVAYMRLFVVANSLVMFMTLSWPHLSTVLDIIGEYFAEWN